MVRPSGNWKTCIWRSYRATDFKVPGKGKMEIKWTSEDGKKEIKHEVFNFTGPGVALSMYNLDKSIEDFARSCFSYGLIKNGLSIFLQKIQFLKNTMEDLKIFLKKFLITSLKINLRK